MNWSQFWEGFTLNYLDVWFFIRPFLYGGVGGISLFLMSYINNSSSIVERKNELQFAPTTDYEKKAQKTNTWRSRFFRFKAAMVHFFVGGVSGMIAVNAFNPSASELQTFSIAVIAGLSGFAFLKRSALADDNNSEKMLDVELSPLLKVREEQNIHIIQELQGLPLPTFLPEEPLEIGGGGPQESEELDELLDALQNMDLLTEDEAEFYRNLQYEGYSDDDIMKRIFTILDDV